MTSGKPPRTGDSGFLFSLDVLIRGKSNRHALERLLALLNGSEEVTDYRVTKGMQLGRVIDEAVRLAEAGDAVPAGTLETAGGAASTGTGGAILAESKKTVAKREPAQKTDKAGGAEDAGKTKTEGRHGEPAGDSRASSPLIGQLSRYIADHTLVRLTVVKGRGVRLSIPCRILNYDESAESLTVYHVDEKKVYSFNLAEIDDLIAN